MTWLAEAKETYPSELNPEPKPGGYRLQVSIPSRPSGAPISIAVMYSGMHPINLWDNKGTVYSRYEFQKVYGAAPNSTLQYEHRVVIFIGRLASAAAGDLIVYAEEFGHVARLHGDSFAVVLVPGLVSIIETEQAFGIGYKLTEFGSQISQPPPTIGHLISVRETSYFVDPILNGQRVDYRPEYPDAWPFAVEVAGAIGSNSRPISRWAFGNAISQGALGMYWYIRAALNISLVASFTATPRSGTAPLNVQFTDTTYTGPHITISQRLWDFGDNSTSTQTNPLKTYSAAGTYGVKLTVWYHGQSSYTTEIGYITVGAGGPPTGVPNPDGPTAEGGVGALASPMPGTPMFALGARAEVMAPFESVLNLMPRTRTVPLPSAGLENSSHARSIRALAKLQRGLVFGGFLRKKKEEEDEEQEWEALTVGLGDEFREPDRYDDESVGARVGMLWTQRVENGPMRIWVCTSTLVGQAKWWRIMLDDDDGTTGTLP